MDPITDGTQITYIKEDSGQIIPGKLWLVPGETLTVGQDVPAEFATRLVEDNVCRVVSSAAPPPPSSPKQKKGAKENPLGAEAGQ